MATGGDNKILLKACTISDLKREMDLTDSQLDIKVEEQDMPDLAACFDNTEDYLEKLQLSQAQQDDVNTKKMMRGNQAGMKLALKCWRNRNPTMATFKALLMILLSLLKGDVAVRVCKYLSECTLERTKLIADDFMQYKEYLQSFYKALVDSQWPPIQTSYIELTMIQKDKIQRGEIVNEFVRLTIKGKADEILQSKAPIDLNNLLPKTDVRQRQLLLIEGAPGSGKSRLCLHICQEWAKGNMFQEFKVVILVRLRDPLLKEAKKIADLLPRKHAGDITAANLLENGTGENVLWVLDGWDELPTDLPANSIINKLVKPGSSLESPLLNCSIVITSRPSSSASLHLYSSARIEVLGFTSVELEKFFTECLKGDSEKVRILMDRIKENPIIESSCCLPLNASILINAFLSNSNTLPMSNHGIFISVIKGSLQRYLKYRLRKDFPVGDITSPNSLPLEIQKLYKQICKMAFYGVQENKLTFTEDDLMSLEIEKDMLHDMDLLQIVPSNVGDSQQVYICFQHTSIQELLAAVHLSTLSHKKQITIFRRFLDEVHSVLHFYAGITKLRVKRRFLSKFPRFLRRIPASIFDVIRKDIHQSKAYLISLLHCLYEAEDTSLCMFVADKILHYTLDLSEIKLNPLNCLCIGYFLSAVLSQPKVRIFAILHTCSIGDEGCTFLARGLTKCIPHTDSRIYLDLGINEIEQVDCIKGLFYAPTSTVDGDSANAASPNTSNSSSIYGLCLNANSTCMCNNGLYKLCKILSNHAHKLKELRLSHCLITVDEDNGPMLSSFLETTQSLEVLYLPGNDITNCSYIATGLKKNKSIKTLNLSDCNLTDESIQSLCTGLNDSIELLHIHANAITDQAINCLAESLPTASPNLKHIKIPIHLEDHINTDFQRINEQRRGHKLSQVKVEASP